MTYHIRFSTFFILIIIFAFGEEKSSKEIERDINSRKSELQILRKQIKIIEENLIKKNKEAISTTETLIELENKIGLTKKLIKSLNYEEKIISESILNTKNQILNIEELLLKLKKQLKTRLQYLYINGRPSLLETILTSKNWNSAIYKIKYLDILSEHEKYLRGKLQNTLIDLESKKKKLQNDYKIKIEILNEKKQENKTLKKDQKNREVLLSQIKKDKKKLETTRINTNRKISDMQNLIDKLYSDKKAMEKRERELARIRSEQNKSTTGNFAIMKGKLIWPVKGKIISRFGTIKNPQTGVYTENVGIDIKANSGTKVVSILDGVVSTITYIRGHGNIVIIDHGGGFSSVYAQIDNILVNENNYVQMGSNIGSVAVPEDNSISHLHFEIWGNQQKQNPELWLIKK
mgnify:CR=1 FL=1